MKSDAKNLVRDVMTIRGNLITLRSNIRTTLVGFVFDISIKLKER